MKRLFNISIIIMLLLGLMQSTTSTAIPAYSTLWEQLRSGGGTYSNTTNGIYAEDFTLTSAATIAQVELWNSMATPPASIQIDFYDNTNNLPGILIKSEVITNAVTAFDGNGTPQQYRTTLTLTNPLSLDPGRYWVAIYSSDALFGWALGSPSSLPGSAWKIGEQAWDLMTWQDLAFRIIGTWSEDLTAPVVSVPDDMTVPATSSSGAEVIYVATANDDVDGPITPICAPESGSIFALGTTTVDCTATDTAGNIGSASFTVTVSDLTPPVVSVPEDMTVSATSSSGAVVTFAATAEDDIDGILVPTCAPASGSTFSIGATTVTCTATDTAGNTGSASFVVTVTSVPLDILPETLPVGEVSVGYSEQLTVVGGAAPYGWSSSVGDLPGSFGIEYLTGVLSGTSGEAGTFNFKAIVTDVNGLTGERYYSLTIHPALTFSPDILAPARLNTLYYQEVSVSGRTDEVPVLTLDSGTLPTGITFSGTAFTGTPTAEGMFENIVIKATYTDGLVKTKTYTLSVIGEHLFTWDPPAPDEKTEVTFTPATGFNSYYWTRGYNPGESCGYYGSYGYNGITYTFDTSGQFQVCLKVRDGYGNEINDSQWVTVNNSLAPEVYGIWIEPEPSFPGMTVSGDFDYDRGPSPFSCEVNWGDGTPKVSFACGSLSAALPEHIYTEAGTYTVQVWVTDGDGLTGTASTQHEVVYLLALRPYETYLASNNGDTTVRLEGNAALGYAENLFFYITDLPGIGYIAQPEVPATCVFNVDANINECWAEFIYTPSQLLVGEPGYEDSFNFRLEDSLNNFSNTVIVRLWVDENAAPTALPGSATVSAVNPTIITLRASDPDVHGGGYDLYHDRMTFIIDTDPANGTLTDLGFTDCDYAWDPYDVRYLSCRSLYEYTPFAGTEATTDSFSFHVNDSHYDSVASANFDLTLHSPTTILVNATDDGVDGYGCNTTHCSLREAVAAAMLGDIIEFGLSYPATITLAGQAILIGKDLTINGPGADKLTISGGADLNDAEPWTHDRVFKIGDWEVSPVNVTISGLTIRDGRAVDGGGILVDGGGHTLYVEDSVIGPNNIVTYAGGGITNYGGDVTLNRCTVTENEGTGSLGGAGVTTAYGATTTLINSTVSGNITNNFGGGIYVFDALVRLIHTTVSGNISNFNFKELGEERGGGAGIYLDYMGQVELQNSIVAGNTDMTDPATAGHEKWHDVHGPALSLGGNLIGDPTGSTNTWAATDLVGTAESPLDPLLGALSVNDPGTTSTMALLEGSPAIDGAPTCEVTIDQRIVDRPQPLGGACDIGAYELEQTVADTTSPELTITGATADGLAMTGDLGTGYILNTTNDPHFDHLIQFADSTDANEALQSEYFGLKLINSTVTSDGLKAYYDARGVPEPYLAYLKAAADGTNPFVYIKGDGTTAVSLVDAAKHDLASTDVDMTVPDDFPLGTYTVAGVIKDLAGNETTVTLILIVAGDREPPMIAFYDDVTKEATGPDGAIVTYTSPSTTDNMDDPGTANCTPASDTQFALGDTTVTCNATDAAGNAATPTTFVVHVVDTTPPVVTVPENITVTATDETGAIVTFSVSAYDLVDGSITPNCDHESGSLFLIGTTTVACTATDAASNQGQASFTVTVNGQTSIGESQLTSARTKCSLYASGEALYLDRLFYTVTSKKGIESIKSISPSDFLYYVKATLPAGAVTLVIKQENDYSFPGMGASVTLYDENCVRLSPQLATVTIVDGNITIDFVEGTTDRFIIAAVKYTAKLIIGQVVSKPYTFVEYVFSAALNEDLPFTDANLELEYKP